MDRRQAMHDAVAFGNSTTARAIHANRADLIEKVIAPYRSATSQISPIGAISPSIEYTDSKQASFGRYGSAAIRRFSRSPGSLWRKIWKSAPVCRMPWIIEAWFAASEKTIQSEIFPASIERAVSFAT